MTVNDRWSFHSVTIHVKIRVWKSGHSDEMRFGPMTFESCDDLANWNILKKMWLRTGKATSDLQKSLTKSRISSLLSFHPVPSCPTHLSLYMHARIFRLHPVEISAIVYFIARSSAGARNFRRFGRWCFLLGVHRQPAILRYLSKRISSTGTASPASFITSIYTEFNVRPQFLSRVLPR